MIFGEKGVEQFLELVRVFVGEDSGLGGESVAQGIEGDGGASVRSARAGRELGVATIGVDLGVRNPGEGAFVPDAGDFVWLTFDPQAGRAQAGRRPALVLSPRIYNARSGLALACPVTNQAKGYPFEVPVPTGGGATGVILADQIKSIDWKARHAERLGRCTDEVMGEVRAKLAALLGY